MTGGAGFIGSHVCDRLLAAGIEVVIVDDLSAGRLEHIPPDAGFYQLELQSPWLEQILEDERPDVILHHAAQISVRRSVTDPLADAEVNVLGSLRLLQLALRTGVRRIVFASTGGAMYGDVDALPTPEDWSPRPVSPYGVAKLSVEQYLRYYHAVHGLSYASLRYANVYGPRQDPYGEAGVVAIFSQRLLAGQPAVINGDGLQTRDYVYVEDVVEANLRALESTAVGAFNIGTATETSVLDLFHRLRQLTDSNARERHGPPQPGEQRRSCLSITRAERELAWRPRITLDEGLKRTVEHFRRAVPQPAAT